jgi:hypothetical protein
LGNAPNPRIVVFTGGITDAIRIYLCGAIPRTTFSRFTRSAGAHVVRAICACRIFILHIRSPASELSHRNAAHRHSFSSPRDQAGIHHSARAVALILDHRNKIRSGTDAHSLAETDEALCYTTGSAVGQSAA